jgi:hypothetical protein
MSAESFSLGLGFICSLPNLFRIGFHLYTGLVQHTNILQQGLVKEYTNGRVCQKTCIQAMHYLSYAHKINYSQIGWFKLFNRPNHKFGTGWYRGITPAQNI